MEMKRRFEKSDIDKPRATLKGMNRDRRHEMVSIIGSDRRANVAIIFALCATPIFAVIGCSIDYARAISVRDRMQAAIDAAVLAGRNEKVSTQIATATAYFESNVARHPGTTVTSAFTRNSDGSFSGTATAEVKTTFAGIMNVKSIPVKASAQAMADTVTTTTTTETETQTTKAPGYTPCLHVMSQSANPAWTMISTSDFNASTCVARVRSNGSAALTSQSASGVKFKQILVKGGASITSGAITIVDAPNRISTNATQNVTGDPFASDLTNIERMITVDKCTAANTGKTYNGGAVSPGTFCGATLFNGVQFASGLYIIASGSGNAANGALSLKGKIDGTSGVTFYFADNKSQLVSYAAAEDSALAAPISGITQGVLMFEASNRGGVYDFSMSSVNKQSWAGVVYLPSMNMTLRSLSEWKSMNIALSVNTLYMDSLSSIVVPYPWIPFGRVSPILVEEATTPSMVPVTTSKTTSTPGYLKN
jgi:Flp pilus assembly protein TadG